MAPKRIQSRVRKAKVYHSLKIEKAFLKDEIDRCEQRLERYDFFSFFETHFFVQNTASLTMVIKRCPGGAGGGRSTSKSTCEVPA